MTGPNYSKVCMWMDLKLHTVFYREPMKISFFNPINNNTPRCVQRLLFGVMLT